MSSSNTGEKTFAFIADSCCLLVMLWMLIVQQSVFKVYPTAEVTPYLKTMVYTTMLCMVAYRALATINIYACAANACAHTKGVATLCYASLVIFFSIHTMNNKPAASKSLLSNDQCPEP